MCNVNGRTHMKSNIVNLRWNEQLVIDNSGTHMRYLAPLSLIRNLFTKHFGYVVIRDALSLEFLEIDTETTDSTR